MQFLRNPSNINRETMDGFRLNRMWTYRCSQTTRGRGKLNEMGTIITEVVLPA